MTHEEATRRFYAHLWPHRAMVLRTATFLCRSATEADDLAQETMLKGFKAIESFDVSTSASAWLATILRHTHIDRLRSGARSAKDVALEALDVDPEDLRSPEAVADVQNAEAMLEAFSDARVISALKELPEEIRWTLLLVDVEQMGQEEAAVVLGVPTGTVKSRVHRGRRMLKDALLGDSKGSGMIAEQIAKPADERN